MTLAVSSVQQAPGRRRVVRERPRRSWARTRRVAWLLVLVLATALLLAVRWLDVQETSGSPTHSRAHSGALSWAPAGAVTWAGRSAAGALAVVLVTGLAARSGGRPVLTGLLTAVGVGAALATGQPVLLGAAAVLTAVVGAVLAVMATTPAATFLRAAREVLVAFALAAATALAVAGFAVPLDVARLGYVVLGLSLLGGLVLVYSLGAGLHGLGRRGRLLAVAAVLLLALALAYSEALAHWGSPELVDAVDGIRNGTRGTLHAVPHPIEVLVGIPGLLWGVFMRARRRQGWWVTAFGTAFTAPVTTRLVDPTLDLTTTVLSEACSLVLGLLLGYGVVRAEQALTGSHGRRARRREEAGAHRPEAGRTAALQ